MIRRLLVANRGEIAVRIIRACRELGLESVAVHTDVDASALHVRVADRAEPIGAASAYLDVDAVVSAARRVRADAVHPGYGFLAENPALAEACDRAGLIFVGPPADVMRRTGSKIAARALAARAGLPVVPGAQPSDQRDEAILRAVAEVGYPALLKAAAGGGGRGMRIVRRPDDAPALVAAARREAAAAFGDGTLYVERLLENPRHVEIQVLCDAGGGAVHLLERECSVQRRHQKIVEEAPAALLPDALRREMGEAALAFARAAGYVNAGTVEFLVEGEGPSARFYFLEMNTRLQVEHPVTEAVTGLDLVRAQIEIAAGGRVPGPASAIAAHGHAIECRIYAEDPARGFVPQAGRILLCREPAGPGIRVDSGIAEGSLVPLEYDPLLLKVVTHAGDRAAAIARMRRALAELVILGVTTNAGFLADLVGSEAFRRGELRTATLDADLARFAAAVEPPAEALAAAAWSHTAPEVRAETAPAAPDPWDLLRGWR
ncbi:MAG TPA: biotin carboxylase N-terminal domain-containing protein [Vicinamibacterales bacterium]|nr:biotin carboxylase N-terminal domain-containing protein [Vicinamibacterales bacterium]